MHRSRLISTAVVVVGIATTIVGVPGLIEDANTWGEWLSGIPNRFALLDLPVMAPLYAVIGGLFLSIVIGPLLWTSGWWYPKVQSRFKRNGNKHDVVVDTDAAQKSAVQQFKALLRVIKRQADSRHPARLGQFGRLLNPSADFDIDFARLTDKLGELSIPYPPLGTSETHWYAYLVYLLRLAEEGKLEEARTLWPTLKAAEEHRRFQAMSSKINECKRLAMQLDLSDFITRQSVNPTEHKERQAKLSAELEHLRPELNSIGISLPGFDVNSQSEIPNLIEYLIKLGVHARHGDIQAAHDIFKPPTADK